MHLATAPAPSLPAPPFVGVLADLQRDPLGVMQRAAAQGPVVRLPLPLVEAWALNHPRHAEHVLVSHARNFAKQTRGYEMLRKVLGNGLVTSEGAFWKRQRRIAQPAFHRERLAGFADSMVSAATEAVASWPEHAPFDLAHALMHCTLRIVGQTMLSTDVTREAEAVGDALTVVLGHLIRRTVSPFAPPEWVPTPGNRAFARALATLDQAVLGVITQRRREGPKADLLSMLMDQADPETGEVMDDQQLRDEVMTVFLAGHETTANALAWTFALLGQAPDVLERVVAEVDAALGARPATLADLPRLPLLARVIKESLRLYPPVWALGRTVLEDDVLDGVRLRKGALVFVCPWSLHRLPEFWPRPETFDPERWLGSTSGSERGAYLPFSLGQRKCIGDGFALAEAQLLLATIVQRATVQLVPGQRFVPEPVITLRPRDGVHVTIARR
jgi:cytochrome P450